MRAGRCVPGLRACWKWPGRSVEAVTSRILPFRRGRGSTPPGGSRTCASAIECLLTGDETEARAVTRASFPGSTPSGASSRRRCSARPSRQVDRLPSCWRASLRPGLAIYDAGLAPGRGLVCVARSGSAPHRPVIAFAPARAAGLDQGVGPVGRQASHVRDVLDAVATTHPGSAERFGGHVIAAGYDPAADGSTTRHAFAAEVEAADRSRRHAGR